MIQVQHSAAAPAAERVEPAVGGTDNALDEWHGPPVDGAELLTDIEQFAGRFLALPTEHHLVVLSLWITHTWAVNAFYVTPRLVLSSPEPGSGKTRLLEIMQLLCRDAKLTLSTTTAALYRRIKAQEVPPTILQDECDAVFGNSRNSHAEDLRALFNAGYRRGATVDRCERESRDVTEFPVFAPVALAGLIGGAVAKHMRTVLDRAVVFHMQRRAPDEHVDDFRGRDAEEAAAPMRQRLRAWADEHLDDLRTMRPDIPDGVRDRRAECWEALLAIADTAGGTWPERAREACCHFELATDLDDERLSLGIRLLRDMREVFGANDRMHSASIVRALVSDPGWEWNDLPGKPLDQRRLAKELKPYGVESGDVRIGDFVRKGYVVEGQNGLGQAWRRWHPSPDERYTRDNGDIAVVGVAGCIAPDDQRNSRATVARPADQQAAGKVAAVADVADEPLHHFDSDDAGGSSAPAESSPTLDDQASRLHDQSVGDLTVSPSEKAGAGHAIHPGEAKRACPDCGFEIGPTTGKCIQCILERARSLG